MSQSTTTVGTAVLAQGLAATSDPDETMVIPQIAPAVLAEEEPPEDVPERERYIGALIVAQQVLRAAPLPHGVFVFPGGEVRIILLDDNDRSCLARYQSLFGGEITHAPGTQGDEAVRSELQLRLNDVPVQVSTDCPMADAAVAA